MRKYIWILLAMFTAGVAWAAPNARFNNLTVDNVLTVDVSIGGPFTLTWGHITGTPTTLSGYGITDALSAIVDNSITPAKLRHTVTPTGSLFYRDDGEWADPGVDVQAQLDAKQNLDADLSVLSYPTAWRIFYSNGTRVITELALGADNTYLRSNGATSAPTWSTTGSGTVTSLDNTTMDNTTIGATTPSTGAFTTLERGAVSDDEFGYLSEVTSDIQAQIDLKRALDNVTFTGMGVATFDNEVTATLFSSTGADGTHYVNVANSSAPSGPSLGDCYYDNGTLGWLCWNGSAWAASTATSVHWDNVTGKAALPQAKDFVIKGYAAGDNNMLLWKADQAQTLTRLDCMTGGADNVTLTLMECDSSAANCATTGLSVAATSSGASDTSASNGSIDADDWVRVLVASIQGTPSHVACTVRYTVAMP